MQSEWWNKYSFRYESCISVRVCGHVLPTVMNGLQV